MPRLLHCNPTYRHHRASGQAIATIEGRDFYLGPWKSKASKIEYDRVVAEWLAAGRRLPASQLADISVGELIERFLVHVAEFYVKAGQPTSEQCLFKSALKVLNRLYGVEDAGAFGPLALEAVRGEMIRMGWCRRTVNSQTNRIRLMFKWGVSKQLVSVTTHQALATVSGLRAGRSAARESVPIQAVREAVVEATLEFCTNTVAAMVRLQHLTGARPGELCSMRVRDVDRAGETWLYKPRHFKTEHHANAPRREIYIGPRGQQILAPFLMKLDPDAYVFSPIESEKERRQERHLARKTPLHIGNRPGTNCRRKPKRTPREHWDAGSYRHAIVRACDKADAWAKGGVVVGNDERIVPRWHPHQLRHTAATELRRKFGIEATQVVLGHSNLTTSEIYAAADSEAARKIMAAVG